MSKDETINNSKGTCALIYHASSKQTPLRIENNYANYSIERMDESMSHQDNSIKNSDDIMKYDHDSMAWEKLH